MRLDDEEMLLFTAACADLGNEHAQELLNLFGAEAAGRVLELMPTVPLGLFTELVGHVWRSIDHARRRDASSVRFVVRSAAG